MTVALPWGPSLLARRMMIVIVGGLAAALALTRPGLIIATCVPMGWFVHLGRRAEPASADIEVNCPERCFVHEHIVLTVRVALPAAVSFLAVGFTPGPGLELVQRDSRSPARLGASDAEMLTLSLAVRADTWGRHGLGSVLLELQSSGGLRSCRVRVDLDANISVYPEPSHVPALVSSAVRYDRMGEHASRAEGAGIEFHEIRAFRKGDRAREINWPISTRRGDLHVTTRRAERAIDVVAVIDLMSNVGPDTETSRDLGLRGALGVVKAALREHDRVGVVALGGRLRWVRPDMAPRQFYRVAEAALDVVDVDDGPGLRAAGSVSALPYRAVPAGAQIVFFSPLIHGDALDAVRNLAERGHAVVVVNTCRGEPEAPHGDAAVALRLWRLERVAQRADLAARGVQVVEWDGGPELALVIGRRCSGPPGAVAIGS